MRLTLFEQSEIRVGARTDADTERLGQEDAAALVDLGERMGARFASWAGPARLRIQQFVGVIRVGDLQLEILPKLDGLPEPARVRRNLLAMLAETQDLEVQESEAAFFEESVEPFICAVARLYCRRLLEAVRRGLRQDYVLHQEPLPRVRGKIDWPSQAKSQTSQRLEFNCIFDERSEDTPLNRALKAALLRAGKLLEEASNANVVTELRHSMASVIDVCPPGEALRRLQTDRMNRHLEPLLALAKLILANRNPDLGRAVHGSRSTYALVWDMNVLFEEYVGRRARAALGPRGYAVDLQEDASEYLAKEVNGDRDAFLLRPDILVRRDGKPCVVADTKWKRLSSDETNLGISGADIYQVLAYAHRYRTDRAVLVYPHHPALRQPGVQREFLTHAASPSRVSVRVVSVDLARLESVPAQLEQGLLPDRGVVAA